MRYSFLFTAGGTGGHIFPAIAVYRIIDKPILFISGKYGMEKTIFEKEKIDFKELPVKGLASVSIFKKILRTPSILISLFISLYYILKFNPKIFVGFGGYASFPVLFWAKILNKNYFLQEQNSIPGLVTKYFSKGAKAIFAGFPDLNLKGKVIFTGNPLRKEFYEIEGKEEIKTPLNIFILGGSQGSKFLDDTIFDILPDLKNIKIKITHQTRKENLLKLEEKYKETGIEHKLFEFIDTPWNYYKEADLIISRAGALTVSEVAASGRCAIFIPFKGAAQNHQYFNAKYMYDSEASFLIEENKDTGQNIINLLNKVQKEPEILIKMGKKAGEKGNRCGIKTIKDILLSSLKGGMDALQEI